MKPASILRPLLLIIFSYYIMSTGFAQDNDHDVIKYKPPLKDRIFFGGNLGLAFGDITMVDISPLIGYKVTPALIAGVGVTYQFFQDKRVNYKSNVFGGRLFGRYYTPIHVYFHSEYEFLTYDGYDPHSPSIITENNVYIGIGYSEPIGEHSGIEFMILYNLNQGPNSLYPNPIYRMGIGFGI